MDESQDGRIGSQIRGVAVHFRARRCLGDGVGEIEGLEEGLCICGSHGLCHCWGMDGDSNAKRKKGEDQKVITFSRVPGVVDLLCIYYNLLHSQTHSPSHQKCLAWCLVLGG